MATIARATTRRRMAGAERRRVVELAAGRRFARHGFAGTRLDDVAADAGVTKPIIYRHFASKKDLYMALLRKHRDDLAGFIDEAEPPVGDAPPAQVILSILDVWLEYVRENRHAWVMLFRDHSGDEEIQALRLATSARAREVMAGFVQRLAGGTMPDQQVEPTAEVLVSGLAGLVLWWIDHPEADPDAVRTVAARIALGALPASG